MPCEHGIKRVSQIVFGDDISMLIIILYSIVDPAEIQHRTFVR
jgi:hypothetical protein